MKKALIFSWLAIATGVIGVACHIFYHLTIPISSEPIGEADLPLFSVRSGENFISIGNRLQSANLIRSSRIMRWYLKFSPKKIQPKRGTYRLSPNQNLVSIIETIASGKSVSINVTIPEGYNLFQIAELLDKKKLAEKNNFIHLARNSHYIKNLNIIGKPDNLHSLEGFLYPDTYAIDLSLSTKEIIAMMIEKYNSVFRSIEMELETSPIVQEFNFNPYQVLTLASITEKETGAGHERPLISGVWINRLRKNMKLQSDPTIIYGMWDRDGHFNGNIQRKDIRERTPYNTYAVNGLPKGPIANPGLNAIKSVLQPKQSKYIYFVSRNDGTHVFTKTYKEHLTWVRRLQINPNARKNKSWRDLPKEMRAN